METINDFLAWKMSAEAVITEKIYIDICDDIVAGMLLAKIAYYLLVPAKYNWPFIKELDDGKYLIKTRDEWYDEIRISKDQYRRARNLLINKGLITIMQRRDDDGLKKTHIRVNDGELFDRITTEIKKYSNSANDKQPKKSSSGYRDLSDTEYVKKFINERSSEYKEWWKAFCEMRSRMRKPLTSKAKKMKINKLQKHFKDDFNKHIELFKRSVDKGWQDVVYAGDINQNKKQNNNRSIREGY